MGKNVKIISADVTIGEGTEIGDNTTIIAYERLVIGKFCKIRSNAQFKARIIEIGDWFYSDNNPRPLVIGGGGAEGPTAIIKIGDRCVIHDSFINVTMPVTIGDDVGMSPSSDIITHGFWQNSLDGFSGNKEGPVTIGNGTIIGYRVLIMPSVTIGKNVSIGAGAIVTKDIPDYCVAVGIPAKVILGPPDYPKKLTIEEKKNMCWQIMMRYSHLLRDKVDFEIETCPKSSEQNPEYIEMHGIYNGEKFRVGYSDGMIVVEQGDKFIAIDPIFQSFSGENSEISDDLRDFLRHYGIRIFSGRWFKSIDSKTKRRLNI
jgi:acetyltransferase-like isoleucine patch superfamily enzyme